MYNDYLKEPLYFHREYENDLPKQEPKMEGSSQALRVAKVALPFVALYRPFGSTLACGLGVARTMTTLKECFAAEDYQKLSWALFNTCLAVGSVAGTIFFHPLGMLIATLNDIGVNIYHVYSAVSHGEMVEAGKQTVRVANNTLYLAMLILGSIELQLASLALQVLVEGSESYAEFNKGNILEMIGHLGMCMVRGSQSYAQLRVVQRKWTVASISRKVAVPKPCAGGKASSLEVACVKGGKWHPALGELKEQHKGYLDYADLQVVHEDNGCFFNDEIGINLLPEVKAVADKGDLVAVWLDADASGICKELSGDKDHFAGLEKSLYISYYNASTGIWSQPNGLAMGKIPEEGFKWSLMSADPIGNALILLKDANKGALESITFDSVVNSWSPPVQLADHLPSVTAFDADALGNCTLAWNDKTKWSIPTVMTRTYDANSKTWNLPVSFETPAWQQIDLTVRRDHESNIVILGRGIPDDYYRTFVTMFNGKEMQWSDLQWIGLNKEDKIADLISIGNGQFRAFFTDSTTANFDCVKNAYDGKIGVSWWKIAMNNPKLGKINGDLYLFWDEFGEWVFPEDNSAYDLIQPINVNGMKWNEEKGEWNPMGAISQCLLKSFFGSNSFYAKSIDDDGLHVIWKDGEEYLKKTIPLQ